MASGSCQRIAPTVFGFSTEGWVSLLDEHPGDEQRTAVRQAADICPVGAIEIIEEPGH
ncbi:ferredoxin [Mycolicibacterium helvum]|nr:ferredoxin [Mycolicibacterium helvum]